jgi:hypothetical protein
MRSKQGEKRAASQKPKAPDTSQCSTKLDCAHAGTWIGRRKAMSGTGLGAVLLMIGMVMLVMFYWKQIVVFLLFVTVTVFCFGIYFIVRTIGSYMP